MDESLVKEMYEELADKIKTIIPVKWDKILLRAEVQKEVNSVYYCFYESETGQLKEYSSLTKEYGVDRKRRMFFTTEISRIIKMLYDYFIKIGEKKWTTITYILEKDGTIKVEYGYEDLDNSDEVTRKELWKEKYL
ncbi:MAG: DUF600 family protein [Clostridiales bacterium]|nr:DUF600 family protein [Clostridiales bacterium]